MIFIEVIQSINHFKFCSNMTPQKTTAVNFLIEIKKCLHLVTMPRIIKTKEKHPLYNTANFL